MFKTNWVKICWAQKIGVHCIRTLPVATGLITIALKLKYWYSV